MSKVRYRTFDLEGPATNTRAAVDESKRTVDISFSSELPVLRSTWQFGDVNEVLDHHTSSVRMGRLRQGASVLFNHDRDKLIGVVERAQIDPRRRRGVATIRVGEDAESEVFFQKLRGGILRQVSVGYQIHDFTIERADEAGGTDTLRVIDWEPLEISLVSIAADETVGVGRSERGNKMDDDDFDDVDQRRDAE